MRPDATYYIAPDDPTEENRCCTFMEGLAAPVSIFKPTLLVFVVVFYPLLVL